RAATSLTAVLSHLSAAAYWGWELKTQPAQPCVTVPRNRNIPEHRREGVRVTWADLRPDELRDGRVTSPDRTVIDCIRTLPFDEALAVADSALRHRHLTKARLIFLADQVTGKGARQARRVAALASPEAANPFESVLRAIAIGVPGLQVEPQVKLVIGGKRMRPDLLDRPLGLAVEAESFEWHGMRPALDRDCARYNAMAIAGLVILRFSWEQVMRHPSYVADCLAAMVAARQPLGRANLPLEARKSA
ncbi:MAG: hypothetical protein ACXWDI_16805, partial [Nocardioides sp.]